MSGAVAVTRTDLTTAELRRAAGRSRDAKAARRMLAIALVLEGVDRKVRLRRGPSDFGYDPMISPTLCLISSTALKSKFSLPPMAFAVGSGRMRTSSGSSRKVLSATGKWQPRRGGMACAGRC